MTSFRGDLGPKQLAWLREKVLGFETMERQALAAAKHREELLAKLKSEKGQADGQ